MNDKKPRYESVLRLWLILGCIAYKFEHGKPITGETIYKAVRLKYTSKTRVRATLKELSDMGALVWAEPPRSRRTGVVGSIHPEKLPQLIQISESTMKRLKREGLEHHTLRQNAKGKIVVDAKGLRLAEPLRTALREFKFDPEKAFDEIDMEDIEFGSK